MPSKPTKRPEKATKDQIIQLRATAEQKRMFGEAATRAGASLSTWMVQTCLKAARAELAES